ncbi:MAG: enoyl-CoA hydratase-related protein [Ilumatobacter sp.]
MDLNLERIGDVIVLDTGVGEKRFNPESVAALNSALDDVMAIRDGGDQIALVVTGSDKFFSNGIDLEWMFGDEAQASPDTIPDFLASMMGTWARILSLPIPTVAAINGHAFAGGAMYALSFDHVLMRADRGYWCVNEVLLQMPLAAGMQALLEAKLPAPTLRKAILTAHRFDGASAVAAGIADEALDDADLRPRAIELAQSLAPTANPILGRLKEDLYAQTLAALRAGDVPTTF